MKRIVSCLPILAAAAQLGLAPAMAQDNTWSTFNGDLKAQKYSPADQITPQNVATLKKAWETHTGDVSDGSGDIPMTVWSATPLFVNDTIYVGTPFYNIVAIEPDTGKVKWRYDSHAILKEFTQPDLKTRGAAYWEAENPVAGQPCQKRVYMGTADAKLHAVDADTGKPCADFGENGVLDINKWNTTNAKWPLSILQPPTVYKDKLFLGWAGKDWSESIAPPGTVFALDARTGKLEWTFDAIPKEMWPKTGTSNVWASMSVDPDMNILYLPVSSPSPNFYGVNRPGDSIPLATSVTAVDTESGKIIWSRQLVHHDLWDYDTNQPPTLVDIEKDGKKIPALVQASKQGFFYILNRYTGEPIYPIEERPVPASDIPGEVASKTQPYVAHPKPVIADEFPGVFWLADALSFGYCSRKLKELRNEGRFTPPSLKGTIAYPATISGVEWGGGAVDPETQTYVVNSSHVVLIYKLIPRDEYKRDIAGPMRETGGLAPMNDSPYGVQTETFLNPLGMPCWKPPYGEISGYNLKTGDLLWRKPMGAVQQWGFYMPDSWGSVTIGGPAITKSGLVFIGASMDSKVRAFDAKTGDVLWKAQVEAPTVALPAIYMYKGKQYVVFVSGGNSILTPRVSDQVVAYTLPD